MKAQIYIGVIGGRAVPDETYVAAQKVGKLLAEAGVVVVCGGLNGVMEAAAKGAFDVGGTVIGILPGPRRLDSNDYLSYAVATGMGTARNAVIVHTCDGFIAVGGAYGTLSEIALALGEGKPVVVLDSRWRKGIPGIEVAKTPIEAVGMIMRLVRKRDAME